MPKQNLFDQLLAFMNLHSQAKNAAVLSICSGEMQSDWVRAFWPIYQEQDFS